MLAQKAVPLSWACHVFLHAYGVQWIGDIKSVQVNLEMAECNSTIFILVALAPTHSAP